MSKIAKRLQDLVVGKEPDRIYIPRKERKQ